MITLPVNPEKQDKMAQYMRNQFSFNGVDGVQRKQIVRSIWQDAKTWSAEELLTEIENYYAQSAREYQYVAIDLAVLAKKKWSQKDLQVFLKLAQEKTWWDSIDAWRKVFTEYVKLHPDEFDEVAAVFVNHENFWVRRIGIDLQLGFKEKTNLDYLTMMIDEDIDTDEFFIQKAIGWSLREYAKTDQEWVAKFVETHKTTPFATKEATKHFK
ncbi:DNA alkylation repair protein [Lactobacillus sp. YT155]|uniref:DNA alkylation repair protein n=1 Tax=Lactobacillus sp. YT155 TaxID=3060955 RepID=UPI00265E9262|nr:DNA alkylation repair protein [Lactobacillus sp. YT155]MDO1605732.1 DNA alkylation repair protein [Lactobacillus sp. YT155]